MAYDEALAARVRRAAARPLEEKKMFGGLCFLAGGHMCCGVLGAELMVRVGPQGYAEALARPHARPMDFTGRPMTGMVYVAAEGLADEVALRDWVGRGVAFAESLPPKTSGGKPARGKRPRARAAARGVPATRARVPARTRRAASGTEPGPFTGFGPPTLRFLAGLEEHNEKAWFEAHRADYEAHYVAPGKAFVAALGPRLAALSPTVRFEPRVNGSLFRINRDVRFSRDKTPYKPHLDLWFWEGERKGWDAPGFFFRLAPRQLLLGVGMHAFQPPRLAAFREAVLDPERGAALEAVLAQIEAAGPYTVGGPRRRTVPRGLPADHPRAALLLAEGLVVTLEQSPPPEAGSEALVDWCFAHYERMAPLHRWLLGLR